MDHAYGQQWDEWVPVAYEPCAACGSRQHEVEWLDEARAADLMAVAPHTLANWRALRKGPPASKAGRGVLYARCLLDKWIFTH